MGRKLGPAWGFSVVIDITGDRLRDWPVLAVTTGRSALSSSILLLLLEVSALTVFGCEYPVPMSSPPMFAAGIIDAVKIKRRAGFLQERVFGLDNGLFFLDP